MADKRDRIIESSKRMEFDEGSVSVGVRSLIGNIRFLFSVLDECSYINIKIRDKLMTVTVTIPDYNFVINPYLETDECLKQPDGEEDWITYDWLKSFGLVELMDKEWRRFNEEKEKIEKVRQRLIQAVDWTNEVPRSGDD
ncbi:DNA methyltransferase [Prochlorococcus marinus]|uniref:DNA methyltransferase n=1 Tax=Prochlorococcus TaxID=1218 RepID=UPI001F2175E9|nr:DNA methyltransferase [Prochlorococcus marinus]